MKFKFIALLISFFNWHNIQQKQQTAELNMIDDNQITVVNRLGKSFNMGSVKQLQEAFGKAKLTKEDAEAYEGGKADVYRYKGLEVSYSIHHCEDMEVKGPEFKMKVKDVSYTVGESITKLKAAFPLSYKNRKDGWLSVWIKGADAGLHFRYNAKGIIFSIMVSNDNS